MAMGKPLAAQATRPNVVLIIADDQAWTDFGFMGHPVIRTPRLDALARESVVFPRGYVPTSLCRPSLATIATGLYPHQHGLTGNDPPPGTDRRRMAQRIRRLATLPRILARLGYRCLQTGKWWEGSFQDGGFTDGMTHGDPARGGRHGDEGLAIGRRGLDPVRRFLAQVGDTPFFVWYAPFLPHAPHNPPARLLRRYRAANRSPHVARYYAMCTWFDETCGALLDLLAEQGHRDDTLVAFVVDNGWIQRENAPGYAARSKRSPYEGGVRTPILLRWPGRLAPGRCNALASSVDIAPTILRACGAPAPAALSPFDLIRVARGEILPRRAVFGAGFTHDVPRLESPVQGLRHRWIVTDSYKLIVPATLGAAPELYRIQDDPHEEHDVAASELTRLTALRRRIEAWWPARDARRTRPNLLFVLTDDQRADAFGAAGHLFLQTPVLDRLARHGVRFENAFVTTPICAASRASILCSRHERTHRFTFGTPPLARRFTRTSYPALLRRAGYRTGFVGKFGMRVEKGEQSAMFDTFRPKNRNPYFKELPQGRRHLTDLIADECIEFVRACPRGQPFCLSVSFHAPHAEDSDPRQYLWPESVNDLYRKAAIPLPPTAEPEFFRGLPEFQQKSLNRVRWHWRFDGEEKRLRMTRGYYRMITGVDRALGRVLAELDRLGAAQDTIVVFTSDNGYFLGERGFAGKWTIHEPSLRVPLVVYDPRRPAAERGRTVSDLVLNLDIAPTLLAFAGVEVPAGYQGRSLIPICAGGAAPDWRQELFYEHLFDHPKIPKAEGVRGRRFKYVRYFEIQPVYEELYDLETDPHERRNLARDPAARPRLAALRRRTDELVERYTKAR